MDIKKVSNIRQRIKEKYNNFLNKIKYPIIIFVAACIAHTTYSVGMLPIQAQAQARKDFETNLRRPVIESCLVDCETLEEQLTGQTKLRPESPAELIASLDWPAEMLPIAMWESGGWACELRPEAQNLTMNTNGSIDRGVFQINSHTFADYQRRMPTRLHDLGIQTYEDMFDWEKNIKMAHLIYSYQGLNAWSSYNSEIYKVCERYVK